MYSFHITCPITLTYSELNNYSVLNDRAHLQKKLNEQKETGMKWETAVVEGFFVLEKQRNGMKQFAARRDILELSVANSKSLDEELKLLED